MKTKWKVSVIKNEYVEDVRKTKKGYEKMAKLKVIRHRKKKTVQVVNKKI